MTFFRQSFAYTGGVVLLVTMNPMKYVRRTTTTSVGRERYASEKNNTVSERRRSKLSRRQVTEAAVSVYGFIVDDDVGAKKEAALYVERAVGR